MRVARVLDADQELTTRFLAALGRGLVVAGTGKTARPGFFIFASNFIHDYMQPVYFRKEEVLLKALEACGFPPDEGPVGAMRLEYDKGGQVAKQLSEAAKAWQGGDEAGRAEVVWATSEFTALMRQHFDRLKRLIYPLLEQWITLDDEQRIAEELNLIEFADRQSEPLEKFAKIVTMLEEEASDWER